MNAAENQKLKDCAGRLYRKNATHGDGGTADAIRHTFLTGEKIGAGTGNHIQKGYSEYNKLKKILNGNYGNLSASDREMALSLFSDLENALKMVGVI